MHSSLLIPRSRFFAKKIRASQGRESGLVLELEGSDECDEDALRCYHGYLHNGTIVSKIVNPDGKTFADLSDMEYRLLIRAHILGLGLQDTAFQNSVMSALLCRYDEVDEVDDQRVHWLPASDMVGFVYEKTKPGSLLRRFIVDTFVWAADEGMVHRSPRDVPEQFFRDLSASFMRQHAAVRGTTDIPAEVSCCDYHNHRVRERCRDKKH